MDESEDWARHVRRIKRIVKTTSGWSRSKLATAHAEMVLVAIALRGMNRELRRLSKTQQLFAEAQDKEVRRFMALAFQASEVARISIADSQKAKNDRRLGGKKAASRRPAVAAKSHVLGHWIDWQQGDVLYKNKAAFARAMHQRYPAIENPKTIENWATEWRLDNVRLTKSLRGTPDRLAQLFAIGKKVESS